MKKSISVLLLTAMLVSMLALPGGALADKPRLTVAGEADQAMPEGYGTVEENQWVDWIRENGPADIEVIAISEDNDLERYSMLMASGTAPDIIYSGDPVTMNTLINQRLLMPLDDVIEKYSVEYKARLEKYPFLRDLGSVDGKLYLLGAPSAAVMPEQVRFIRVDWLEKLGLEMPTTVDEYLEVARAFAKNDPDGNGVDDTYGTNLSGKGSVMIDWMFGDARWFIRDGKMVMDLAPSMQASMFKKTLFDEGIVDRDYLIDNKGSKAQQDWVNGKLGIFQTNRSVTPSAFNIYKTLMANCPEAKVAVLPNLEGPNGTFSMDTYNPIDFEVAVNAACKDPKLAIEFIDFMIRDDTQMTLTQGIEGVHYTLNENGAPVPINPETIDDEMSGAIVFLETYDVGDKVINYLNPENPLEKSYIDILNDVDHLVRKDQPIPLFTFACLYPVMPNDIHMIYANTMDRIDDTWVNFIVQGKMEDAQKTLDQANQMWESAGGKKVEEWCDAWYQENKDTYMFTDDVYDAFGAPYEK